ncbi:MAG: type VII secretion-associated protein, partial [Rhodococcus sp. (in: high G+C Gram-positive bacteria)]
MSAEARYVAVHLGENALSVLVDAGENVAERRYRTALSMHAGELVHLDDDATEVAVDNQPGSEADTTVERSLWSFVEDRNVLVGSVAVPVDSAIRGTVEAALRRTGAAGPVRLLEIACPSSWGVARQNIVRRAVTPLAHEVVVVDTATAAVESLGERAPEFGVVVEIGELDSTVSGVSLDSDTVDGELFFVGSGRWDAIGNRNIVAGDGIASIRQRVTDCIAAQGGRRDVDVFVVDTTPDEDAAALPVEPTHRSQRLTGLDVVRSMAARAGVGAATAPSAPRVEPRDVPDAGPAVWPSAAPMSARSA